MQQQINIMALPQKNIDLEKKYIKKQMTQIGCNLLLILNQYLRRNNSHHLKGIKVAKLN